MITINGNKFAKNDSEFIDTLFQSGGTACGYYKKLKNRIIFMNMQKKPFAALVKNAHGNFLVNCAKPEKRYFYQHALSAAYYKLFDMPAAYSDQVRYVDELSTQLLGDH